MPDATWQPPEPDAIRERTSVRVNRRIDQRTRGAMTEVLDSAVKICERLVQLDREWNIDRALMLNFAVLGSITASLTMRNIRKHRTPGGWGVLFFTQMSFLAYHAIRRWCPPMPVFRRLGFRSDTEINAERNALEHRLADLEAHLESH